MKNIKNLINSKLNWVKSLLLDGTVYFMVIAVICSSIGKYWMSSQNATVYTVLFGIAFVLVAGFMKAVMPTLNYNLSTYESVLMALMFAIALEVCAMGSLVSTIPGLKACGLITYGLAFVIPICCSQAIKRKVNKKTC